MRYVLDTNIITALIKNEAAALTQVAAHREDYLYLCPPVYYEAMRGLIWKGASAKIATLKRLRKTLSWVQLVDQDWERASQLWADMVRQGKQLSDVDLLIAAIAMRHDAIIVSDDNDFDSLPIRRENWRKP
jgi:predicted nucleic acid-binding protein